MNASVRAVAVLASLSAGSAIAQTPPQPSAGAAPHVAAAKAAARQDHLPLFNALCVAPPPIQPQGGSQAAAPPQAPAAPPRSEWYAEPTKVFDNLYFVGQTAYTAWAVVTSEGIIVIDPLFEYSVEEEVVIGLTTLGLDPKRIRYVLVSHAHRDHVGGAALLQERFGARVVMSAADWDLLETDPGQWPKAKRDIVATDGQRLTLGDTTLTLILTPGHTLGTQGKGIRDGTAPRRPAASLRDRERERQPFSDGCGRVREGGAALVTDVRHARVAERIWP